MLPTLMVFFSKYMCPMFYLFCNFFYTFVYFNFLISSAYRWPVVGIPLVVRGAWFEKPCLELLCRRFAVGNMKLAGFTFANSCACALEDTVNVTLTKSRNTGSLNNTRKMQPWTLYRLNLNVFTWKHNTVKTISIFITKWEFLYIMYCFWL